MRTLFAFLLLAVAAQASPIITAGTIIGHDEPVPRFANLLPNRLVVPANSTMTLPADSTYDAIEVSGTLRVSRERDTVCRFTHMTILPGGTLDLGNPDDPVHTNVELIIRDVPINAGTAENPGIDPFSIGNGIINFGFLSIHGRKLQKTWTTMQEVQGGTKTLSLDVPSGWRVGDRLLLPDTRQIVPKRTKQAGIRREAPVLIAAIDGDRITLSKPLDFEHLAGRSPSGELRYLPYVANASRNIEIRSENPRGTRGHVIHLDQAHVDVRYASFLGLGRTLAKNIDNTEVASGRITKIGTNQIARYAFHWHHVAGHMDHDLTIGRIVGCFLEGDDIAKWGIVDHHTSNCLISDNVCHRFVGAGVVTEDGPEVRSQFLRNFVMGCKGNGINGKFNLVPPNNIPGGEGAGFWFRGMECVMRDNVSCNNVVGFQLFYRNQVLGRKVPSGPGAQNDTPYDPRDKQPITFENNAAFANGQAGLEYWNSPRITTLRDLHVWHNGAAQVKAGNGEPGSVIVSNLYALAQGRISDGISSSAAYTLAIEIDGGRIEGCAVGVHEARNVVHLRNVRMQNATNVNYHFFRPRQTTLENVQFSPLGDSPKRYVVLGQGQDWQPDEPFPRYPAPWDVNSGAMFVVKNWQGSGDDYLLFERQQVRDKPAWPGFHNQTHERMCPVAGLTMGQCWDRFGMAYGGGVIDRDEAVPLDGLIYGVARKGLDPQLGPPRAVLVSPNSMAPAVHGGKPIVDRIDLHFFLTGKSPATRNAVYALDGSTPTKIRSYFTDQHGIVRLQNEGTSPGRHTVKTWRTGETGEMLADSEMIFTYFVADTVASTPLASSTTEGSEAETAKLQDELRASIERTEELRKQLLELESRAKAGRIGPHAALPDSPP